MPTCEALNLRSTEYDPKYERANRYTSCMVLAISGATFAIHLQSTAYISEVLTVSVFIDGVFQDSMCTNGLMEPGDSAFPEVRLGGRVHWVLGADGNMAPVLQPWKWRALQTVDEGGVQLPRAELDKMGAVKVVVCRCRRRLGALPRAESRTPPPEGNGAGAGNPRARTHWNYNGCGGQAAAGDTPVAEKSLKGSSVSHAVDLGEEKRIQYSTFNGEDVDTLRKPYAIFSFQYRTMGVLASLGLVSKEEGAGEDGNERKRKTYADMSKEELIEELSQRDVIPGADNKRIKREGEPRVLPAWNFTAEEGTIDLE